MCSLDAGKEDVNRQSREFAHDRTKQLYRVPRETFPIKCSAYEEDVVCACCRDRRDATAKAGVAGSNPTQTKTEH